MSKGGHKDPSALTPEQQAAVHAPISGSYMNVAPPRAPLMQQNPGLFGISGAAPPMPYVPQLNFGGRRPVPGLMAGGGKGGAIGGMMGAMPPHPMFNPWGTRGYTP